MPLVPTTLIPGLDDAFASAMKKFMDFKQTGNNGKDRSEQAINAAAAVFAAKAAPAITTYIKTGTVTTVVVTAGSAVAQAGTGTGAVL
tara:strand:+ start:131 stop:394 length:264 start_codon:yes stop_codon:yes gene_type:complete